MTGSSSAGIVLISPAPDPLPHRSHAGTTLQQPKLKEQAVALVTQGTHRHAEDTSSSLPIAECAVKGQ